MNKYTIYKMMNKKGLNPGTYGFSPFDIVLGRVYLLEI